MSLPRKLFTLAAATTAAALTVQAINRRRRWWDLRGKSIIVTGGSRGLGLDLARQLADRGAKIAIFARDADEMKRALGDVRTRGTAIAVQCDVTDREDVDRAVAIVRQSFGRVDAIINDAGVIGVGPHEAMTEADYDRAMRTHFYGPLHLILAVLPEMEQRRDGRIVNISSIGGKIAVPHLVPYTASKFALTGLSEALRTELAACNVFVTTVIPGLMRTGSPRNADFKGQPDAEYAWFMTSDNTPGLSVNPADIAERILDAMQAGDAELIHQFSAAAATKLHALFPKLSAELAAVVERLLPHGHLKTRVKGRDVSGAVRVPRFARNSDETAARTHNETLPVSYPTQPGDV